MGYNVTFKQEDEDKLNVFLDSIKIESAEIERNMLEESGDRLKKIVIAELSKHRRMLSKRYRVALVDDVTRTIRTNKWGEKYVSVRGGRATGTLWHIVNDGNLHSRALHFMDAALNKLDNTIDSIWDKTMK